jgi:hypothetical protein
MKMTRPCAACPILLTGLNPLVVCGWWNSLKEQYSHKIGYLGFFVAVWWCGGDRVRIKAQYSHKTDYLGLFCSCVAVCVNTNTQKNE